MTLIKSISGIRGTIGGRPDSGLTPVDIVKYTAAFAKLRCHRDNKKIVLGRDGRISGKMVENMVISTLQAMGVHVVNLGLSTTPTVEMAVKYENAAGGIILTASHNPRQWNALKLLNENGEFISAEEGARVLKTGEDNDFEFADIDGLGIVEENNAHIHRHIEDIIQFPLVDANAIAQRNFKIVVDGINSSGSVFVPQLLKALGVEQITVLNEKVDGNFAHNPEPLPEHLVELSEIIKTEKADLGISVDPDVDRLCFVNEDGTMFGEEYTLVAVADYMLQHQPGNTVSNLSSTRALRDITQKHGGAYSASAVGEVNVVARMKEVNAVIGGEGNGGIIVPALHYGRDALIGIALFLSHLAKFDGSISELRASYPNYVISKNKIDLEEGIRLNELFTFIQDKYNNEEINTMDGVKIDFSDGWVHLRASNTEPIIRIYSENSDENAANQRARKIMNDIKDFMNS